MIVPIRFASVVVTLSVLLLGCGRTEATGGSAAPRPETAQPKRIAAAILGEPHTLSQDINTAGTGSIRGVGEVERMIHAGVTIINARGERVPMLAEQAISIENGLWKVLPNGTMETRWTLRPDARWHDGRPLTAEDLAFTARVSLDRELAFSQGPGTKAIESVEAVDQRTVLVKWKTTFITADELFSNGFMLPQPRHILENEYVNNKNGYMEMSYWTSDFVGAGAYKVREFHRGSHMELRAFDDFPLGKPRITDITIKFLQDPNILVANLLAGEIELTLGRGLSLDQGIEMTRRWNGRMEADLGSWLAHYPQQGSYANPAVVRDVNFRRALLHAMDRQAVSDELVDSRSPIAHTLMSPRNADYPANDSQIAKYDYDPRKAGQLIEQLGYQKQADGLFYDAQGQKLRFQAQTNGGDDFKDKMLFSTADMWKRAGIDVDVFISPRQLANDREYRATLPGTDLVRQPFDPIRLHSKDIPRPENSWVGSNRTGYTNPEFDRLTDAYYITIPLAERRQIVANMLRVISQDAAAIGVIYDVGPRMISARMVNVAENLGEGVSEAWNPWEWDIR